MSKASQLRERERRVALKWVDRVKQTADLAAWTEAHANDVVDNRIGGTAMANWLRRCRWPSERIQAEAGPGILFSGTVADHLVQAQELWSKSEPATYPEPLVDDSS